MAFPKIEGYVVTERLGTGSYSTVYKAYTKVGARSTVAIKCIDKARIKQSGSAVDNLVSEVRLLKTLTHPHIVQMKEFTWDDRNIYIIMEYCCGGDLSKYIQRYGRVPERQVLYFLQQLASALKFLREKGVVHMDLKPHNLLLHKGSDGKYILKVADFGFAQHMSEEWSRGVRGSPLYMAPEMFSGEYDASVDLWSVGVIMYECLFGRAPYSSSTFKELVHKIQTKAPIEIPRHASVSPMCRDLLSRLLQHDPARRISYEEFFASEYLDLDHMPSRDNYEKAVSLIKQAIELDAAGRLRPAFARYRDALLLLVPAAAAEPDCLRKQALSAKLARYMERAEEIKLYLKRGDAQPAATDGQTVAAPQTCSTSCGGRGSCDVAGGRGGCDVTGGRGGSERPTNVTHSDDANECVVSEERPAPLPPVQPTAPPSPRAPPPPASPPRFTFRRLFRQHSIPYLTREDASITRDQAERAQPPTGEAAGEGCRIT